MTQKKITTSLSAILKIVYMKVAEVFLCESNFQNISSVSVDEKIQHILKKEFCLCLY